MTPTTAYPVAGRFLSDVPSIEHECSDPFCVESDAFTHDPPPKPAATKSPDPAPAGSPDSEEN